jgi:hypothetical protein
VAHITEDELTIIPISLVDRLLAWRSREDWDIARCRGWAAGRRGTKSISRHSLCQARPKPTSC